MRFFVGLHQVTDAKHFERSFISVRRLKYRRTSFAVTDWIMDSGAFSTLSLFGCYPHPVDEYAYEINRWRSVGNLIAAVAQDYMCEPMMLKSTGLTVPQHQALTIERYDALCPQVNGVYVLPVLQGYEPSEYIEHVGLYGKRLRRNAWVGVGSICKRNSKPAAIWTILTAILSVRPDLRLHGFGLKITALQSSVRSILYSADSMAWSFRARKQGRDPNDWREADAFRQEIEEV